MTFILKPEKIKPGLMVNVKWYPDKEVYYSGKVVKKLRKNWLVIMHNFNEERNLVSVPENRLSLSSAYTKEGRALMANKEDHKIFWSKEHIDYCNSMQKEN